MPTNTRAFNKKLTSSKFFSLNLKHDKTGPIRNATNCADKIYWKLTAEILCVYMT